MGAVRVLISHAEWADRRYRRARKLPSVPWGAQRDIARPMGGRACWLSGPVIGSPRRLIAPHSSATRPRGRVSVLAF